MRTNLEHRTVAFSVRIPTHYGQPMYFAAQHETSIVADLQFSLNSRCYLITAVHSKVVMHNETALLKYTSNSTKKLQLTVYCKHYFFSIVQTTMLTQTNI